MSRTSATKKRLLLIDSHALIHRAYHALPPLTAPDGMMVNAVYGFASIFLRVAKELKPNFIAAAFDLAGPTFRHEAFAEYKIQRPKMEQDLSEQIPFVKDFLKALEIPIYEKQGFEADDVLGTIVDQITKKEKDLEVVILTGDMDTLQLVQKNVSVCTFKKGVGDIMFYDPGAVKERFGIEPRQTIDFKGLKGDPSDNIPGVPGVGDKTAAMILQYFGGIDELYEYLEGKNKKTAAEKILKPKVREALITNKDQALFSRELATINLEVPIKFDLASSVFEPEHLESEAVRAFLQRMGFFSLMARIRNEVGQDSKKAPTPSSVIPAKISRGGSKKGEFSELLKTAKAIGIFFLNETFWCSFQGEEGSVKNISFTINEMPFVELWEVLSAGQQELLVFDLKEILHLSAKQGAVNWRWNKIKFFDAKIAAWLLHAGEREYALEKIMFFYTKFSPQGPQDISAHFLELIAELKKKIITTQLSSVLYDIEQPLTFVLFEMEQNGIGIDAAKLKELKTKIDYELASVERNIYDAAGTQFNISSPKQLSDVLFKHLHIESAGLRKTPGGVISTQASELEKLRKNNPIIDLILSHRELSKLKTTYIEPLPQLADKTSRLHTNFNQEGTATGRLSSDNPNLQNIPTRSEWGTQIRRAFVARKGFEFVSFDYSQIELRVAASLAEDKKMIQAFKEGKDIHAMTAAEVSNIEEKDVTPTLRRQAKVLNFGVLYGMSTVGFAEAAGVDRERASEFIKEYFKDFSNVAKLVEKLREEARSKGFAQTLTGRKRFIPEIHSPNWQVRQAAERAAINMPLQGLAADILKIAMVQIYKEILLSDPQDIRLILQVHDELLFEIKKDKTPQFVKKIKNIMENSYKLKVPLVADVRAGDNWGDLEVLK